MGLIAQSAPYTRTFALPATGLTVKIQLSQAGGALADPAAGPSTLTEIGGGIYSFPLQAADTALLGDLAYALTDAVSSAVYNSTDQVDQVGTVGGLPNDSTALLSLAQLEINAAGTAAVVLTTTGGDAVDVNCTGGNFLNVMCQNGIVINAAGDGVDITANGNGVAIETGSGSPLTLATTSSNPCLNIEASGGGTAVVVAGGAQGVSIQSENGPALLLSATGDNAVTLLSNDHIGLSIQAPIGNGIDVESGAVAANLVGASGGIEVDTTAGPGLSIESGDSTQIVNADLGASLANALLDLADGIETSFTVRQACRVILAALAGKTSLSVPTRTFRDVNDTVDRISATTDENGQRTAVTLDAS